MTVPAIVGVYRAENAATVTSLLAPALASGWSTAWWALDAVAPELATHTVGEGSGEKLPLLNETLRRLGATSGPVLLSDDDLAVGRGSLERLVALADRAGLGLAQPAHAAGSHVSHPITRVRPRSRVRLTTFVEGGPLVVVMPSVRDRVLPLPEARGMGWGVEFDWMELEASGTSLGIVDAVTVAHLAPVAGTYDDDAIRARMRAELAARGAEDWGSLQRTIATWRPWQRRAPWLES